MKSQKVRHDLATKPPIILILKRYLKKESKWKSLSCVQLFVTPWTLQSTEFSRPEYWSGQPFPSPGDLPNPGIKPRFPTLQADFKPAEPPGKPKDQCEVMSHCSFDLHLSNS